MLRKNCENGNRATNDTSILIYTLLEWIERYGRNTLITSFNLCIQATASLTKTATLLARYLLYALIPYL